MPTRAGTRIESRLSGPNTPHKIPVLRESVHTEGNGVLSNLAEKFGLGTAQPLLPKSIYRLHKALLPETKRKPSPTPMASRTFR